MTRSSKRIAVAVSRSNAIASRPAPTRADFVARTNLEGEAMTAEATKPVSSIRTEIHRHNSMQS